jgi:DNA-binding CsgD family transcriptional regulator
VLPATWPLTRQERHVLACLLRGLSNAQIAAALVVSDNTVETHLRHMYAKLDVHNRGQLLARFFHETSWPSLQDPSTVELLE